MLFEHIAFKVVVLCCALCWAMVETSSPSSGHPASPHFESLRRKQRTVDTTLPRLGDLQPGAAGVLNQHCKLIHIRVHATRDLIITDSICLYCMHARAFKCMHVLTLPIHTVVPLVDCGAIYNSGLNISGLYYINPDGNGDFLVYCDMSQLDGVYNGWTVIQRRVSNSVDFNKYWNDYTLGFGDLNANSWLGLNRIKRITDTATYKLYLAFQFQDADVVDDQSVRFSEYNSFSLGTSINNYQLSVSSYNSSISTAGDSLISRHNGSTSPQEIAITTTARRTARDSTSRDGGSTVA